MRTPLANVDASWLRMDDPTNPMVVTGVLMLEKPVTVRQVRSLLQRRLLPFERFRQRIVHPLAGLGLPSWEIDPRFSLDHHLVVEELRDPTDEASLQNLIGRIASGSLSPGRPPWRMHLVPHYRGGSALVVRIHHCVADGLALVHVLLSLADPRADPRGAPIETRRAPASTLRGALSTVAGVLPEGARHLAALGHLLILPSDPPTCLRGRLGVPKRLVWSRAFRLEDFKRIGRATDSTVNDVLMAALTGALRRYLLEHGAVARRLEVRGAVPVNLRPARDAHLLGNRFGLVFLQLPLGMASPRARLAEIQRRMRLLKQSSGAAAIFELLWLMALVPRQLFDAILDLFATKATLVVTNVIGPREEISILGSRLRQAMFWVPCAGHLGLGISLLSYAGQVWVGVQSDAGLVPDPERIVAAFEDELDALRSVGKPPRLRGRRTVPVPAAPRASRGRG
jgi:diacylglycerol O-acyltransferase